MKEQEKEIIDHILSCYTQIKNPTFFDVIPKSKIPSIHMKKTETTDLKWISGREVGLRRLATWVWVRWQRRYEVDGSVGLRLIVGLGWLVGQWCRASVAATLRMSQAGGDESETERWEFERVSLREIREMRVIESGTVWE